MAIKRQSDTGRQLQYRKVYDYVLTLISASRLHAGDKLPSATDLAQQTGVSLISVRRGLAELEQEGRIRRRQGLGTFVGTGRVITEPTHSGELLESIANGPIRSDVTTRMISLVVGKASKGVAVALATTAGAPVWEVRRLRLVNGIEAIYERAVLPLSRVPVLDEDYLSAGESLYAYLRNHFGLSDATTEQVIEVGHPRPEERKHLHLKVSDAVVRVRGISFADEGFPYDCYEQTYEASSFIFYVSGSERREVLQSVDLQPWLIEPLRTADA